MYLFTIQQYSDKRVKSKLTSIQQAIFLKTNC